MARVRIVKTPKAQSGLEVKMQPGLYGTNGNNQFNKSAHLEAGKISQQPTEVRQTLQPVPRDQANLEAEKGETAVLNMGGMPAHFKIGGKRHFEGGTPLNLPDNSFIFSDTAKMKIKDPTILAQFGMSMKKGGYKPAEISRKYDINKYRAILADPNSDDLQRKTAEMMIANYNEKLAKLSLIQESIKGFPQGIPVIAMPYIEAMQIDPSMFVPDQAQEQLAQADSPDADMGTARYGSQVISQWNTKKYGELPIAQTGKSFSEEYAQFQKEKADRIKANKEAYLADIKDAQNDAEMNAIYRQYAKVQERQKAKDFETNIWDYLPFVTDSAPQAFEKFANMARAKGIDPYKLEKQITEGVNIEGDPRTFNEPVVTQVAPGKFQSKPSPASQAKQTTDLKKAVETKVKNWLKPTSDEIDNLSDDELMYLNRIHKRYKVAGFSYGGFLTQYKNGEPTAADLRKQYKERAAQEQGTTMAAGEKKEEKKATTSGTGKTSGAKKTPGKVAYDEYDPYAGYTEEEEEERLKRAGTTPEKYVSDEDYEKLKQAYIKAARSSGAEVDDDGNIIKMGDVNKKTKETLEFQKLYHDILGDEARRIIASEKDPTTKGKGLAKGTRYDLEANEDMMFGKRTKQYWQAVKKKPADKPADVTTQKKDATAADRGPINRNQITGIRQPDYAPWWLQDIVKTSGAAADLARVNRYLPWQATPEVRLPEDTFYDPTRELAANAEQANIQTQGLAAFTGPQALSARSSSIQGQAAKNAADIMSRYNNMNVQLANQLNQERTSIMNQAAQNEANLDTQLFDKYTIANQQFDNAKNMARQNLRQSYIDAITNRAKTQALNTLYPNFYTDPTMGGFVNKTGYANITPTKPGNDELDKIQEIIKRFPGTSFKDAQSYLKGGKGNNEEDDMSGYLKAQGYT